GGADEHEELAVFDLEVDLVDRGTGRAGIDAGGLVESDGCHDCSDLLHRQVRAGRSVVNGRPPAAAPTIPHSMTQWAGTSAPSHRAVGSQTCSLASRREGPIGAPARAPRILSNARSIPEDEDR